MISDRLLDNALLPNVQIYFIVQSLLAGGGAPILLSAGRIAAAELKSPSTHSMPRYATNKAGIADEARGPISPKLAAAKNLTY